MIDKVKATNLGQSVKADHFKLVALCIMHRFERLALNMVKTDLAQSIVGYFDTGTSNKVLGALALCREITSYYTNSGLVSYLNITFSLTVD
ncbi:hypothetical protein MRS59_06555 [Lactiplantibacillus plantarum]|uniref:hypothetical protein n=1 Tax=Lactiplantibacillus plantarum TaxID=1590 RepID=UPI0012992FB7|nr:hypothetical protein [Lactiplantibacillus plantarum]MDI5785319.1 hypothetical protein [Lactiplantibacillus plantarum]MYV34298.1 hypothetical protein [Lactiplantibacillus plantarum]NGM27296.1 hypothetical protein [Lactiplantibacillus plantarum]